MRLATTTRGASASAASARRLAASAASHARRGGDCQHWFASVRSFRATARRGSPAHWRCDAFDRAAWPQVLLARPRYEAFATAGHRAGAASASGSGAGRPVQAMPASAAGSIRRAGGAVPGRLAQTTRVAGGDEGCADVEDGTDAALLSTWWKRQRERGGRLRADSEQVQRLSDELEVIEAGLVPHESYVTQKDEFLKRLQHTLAEAIDGAEVAPFGSVVNGFWTAQSDLDICVRVPGASTRNAQIQMLRKIAQELSKFSAYHIEPRFGAQVPILHWAPQRPGMVSCDISINNVLAVVNSRLVGHYVSIDSRLRCLGLCVKAWAQARGINDRSRGTVSSFAIVLMLIHFLQRRDPPALPSLQDLAFSSNQKPMYVAGVDCRYCTDASQIQTELEYLRGDKPPNRESVGFLLLEFFRYFGHEYKHGVIRIRDTRSFLPPVDESSAYLVVDNPYEVGKDVANVDDTQHDMIRKEFRRAWGMLSRGRPFRDLLKNSSLEEATARRQPLVWATNTRTQW